MADRKGKGAEAERTRIAARLREAREARELSQTALAEKAGLSRSSIVHYESANAVPGGLELIRLSKALEISPNRILTGSDEFKESELVEHFLAVDSEAGRILRLTVLFHALDRETQQHLSALVVDIVRQRITDSEFAELIKTLEIMERHLGSGFVADVMKLVESMDADAIEAEVNAALEQGHSDN